MRSKDPMLSVIIPTRNESDNIYLLLASLSSALRGIATEIIIVDDSDDQTPQLIEAAAQNRTDDLVLRLIHRCPGPDRAGGLATAVSAGMKTAHAKYMAVIDADLQHPPERLRALYEEAVATDADVVLATRYRTGGSYAGLDGVSRRFISVGLKWVAKVVFPDQLMRVSDPLGGFFLVRRAIVEDVTLRPIGYKISLELLIRCHWARLVEVPYHFQARAGGESKSDFKQGVMVLQHMVRLVREVPGAARFWEYCAVGASGVLVNLVAFIFLLNLHVASWPAWLAATELSILSNFTLNNVLTWSDMRTKGSFDWFSRTLMYHGAVAPSVAFSFAIFALAVNHHEHPMTAQVVGVIAGIFLSYWLARRVVFAPRENWQSLFREHPSTFTGMPAEEGIAATEALPLSGATRTGI